jgi:hypothetical protein
LKTVIRFANIGVHRIGEQESWLQDMALEGLFIKKVGRVFCRFEKAEPMQMKYRIVPARDMPMTMQMKQASAENGWDYVTSYSAFHLYSSPAQANAPELQIPPADYAKRLKRLSDMFLAAILGFVVYGAIQIFQGYYNFSESKTPYLDMLNAYPLVTILLLVFLVCLLVNSIIMAVSINKLMKSLSAGNPIDHNAPWQKERRTGWIKAVAFFIFFVFVLVFPFTQTTVIGSERKTLPQETGSLPIVRLAEIENNPGLIRDEENAGDDVDYSNSIAQAASLLAPVQIESCESGLISTEKWKDRDGEYTPSISNAIYKLASPFMAERVMLELILYYEDILKMTADYIPCTEISSPHFDRLFVSESNGYFEMFAVKGKVVVHITYGGHAGSDTIIKEVADKVDLISD